VVQVAHKSPSALEHVLAARLVALIEPRPVAPLVGPQRVGARAARSRFVRTSLIAGPPAR
jgi:hypothetical protein